MRRKVYVRSFYITRNYQNINYVAFTPKTALKMIIEFFHSWMKDHIIQLFFSYLKSHKFQCSKILFLLFLGCSTMSILFAQCSTWIIHFRCIVPKREPGLLDFAFSSRGFENLSRMQSSVYQSNAAILFVYCRTLVLLSRKIVKLR